MMRWLNPANVGFAVRSKLADMGYGARLFVRLLGLLGATLRRPHLLTEQIFFQATPQARRQVASRATRTA